MHRHARLLGILLACVSVSSLFFVDGYAQGSDTVTLTLRITDASSGLSLTAEKQVAQGTIAFDAVRQIVSLRYTTHPEFGPFVTELAGVAPPTGCCWLLYMEGEWSNLGLAAIALQDDTVLEFRTE